MSIRTVPPVFLAIASPLLLWGCGPAIHPSFDSPEPAARNAAIVEAAKTKDASAVPDLVRMLDSDDPATRLLAIHTLEEITGQTLGYDHAAEREDREAAMTRWQHYAKSMPGREKVPGKASGAGDSANE